MFASFVRGDAPLPDPVSRSSPFAVAVVVEPIVSEIERGRYAP